MPLRQLLRRGDKRRQLWRGHDRRVKADFVARLVRDHVPRGARHLDIACGSGEIVAAFGALGCRGTGIDIAANRLMRRVQPGLALARADMTAPLPFKDGSFDLVSLISTIEHVRQPRQLIDEVDRVLTPGGLIVVQIPNPFFVIDLHYQLPLYGYLPRFLRAPYRRIFAGEGYSIRYYTTEITKAEVRHLFTAHTEILSRDLVYPLEVAPDWLKPLYGVYASTGLARLMPTGHLFVYRRA